MAASDVPHCQCPLCQGGADHPERERHRQFLLVFHRLDENQRRWFVALEAKRLGHGGDRLLSQITGMDEKTVRRGREELDASLADNPPDRIRRPGGGRLPVEKKDPDIIPVLQAAVEPETAGDPMSDQKWVRSSLRTLSMRLDAAGHPASPPTVGRLLGKLGYALHVNAKKLEASADRPDRQAQFEHIAAQRAAFAEADQPIISVDTKKKELIGNFKNGGATWSRQAVAVNVHDFLQDALGRAVPYGIYEPLRNQGTVYVGQSADTPQFAVDVIARWWESVGCPYYLSAERLLILADGGGSNAYRSRLWKQQIQEQLCDRYGLTVTVCHYPTGCSKWNPVEHRLFGPISVNWASEPLLDWQTILAFIRGTKTTTGLAVQAFLHEGVYKTGGTVPDAEMETLNIEHHAVCPNWNYTIRPRSGGQALTETDPAKRELVS